MFTEKLIEIVGNWMELHAITTVVEVGGEMYCYIVGKSRNGLQYLYCNPQSQQIARKTTRQRTNSP